MPAVPARAVVASRLATAREELDRRVEAVTVSVKRALPRGRLLSTSAWESRHRAIVKLLWLHVVGLFFFAIAMGNNAGHAVIESLIVALPTMLAAYSGLSRGIRSCAAAFGLVTASAVLVHLSGGYTEAHFHFFVVLGILALYQDWGPFLVAIAYVVIHHTLVGFIEPGAVFNHPAARENPLLWAMIHAVFVLAASAVSLVTWRFVERQSLHDPLTDLPNRALFGDRLAHAMARTSRSGAAVSVLFIDLDDFKSVNDRLGHPAGDAMLKIVADRIRACLRAGDTAARLGGDEFAVLIEDFHTAEDVVALSDRIGAALQQPAEVKDHLVVIAASIGRATALGPARGTDDLLSEADKAMYE
ncbi:MAG: diguanylate cyclase, partial [Chloroflexota bacterium]|nr:diguanylate cyclase [Chloroflexota bacterium]